MLKQDFMMGESFVSGLTTNELTSRMRTVAVNYTNFLSYDGSGHDAHQHSALIDAADNYMFSKLLRPFLYYNNIPPVYHDTIYNSIVTNQVRFFTKFGLTGTIQGTVYSGHPTKTTMGNTLRVYLYNQFVMQTRFGLAENQSYKMFVAGEDYLCATSEKLDTEIYTQTLGKKNSI